MNKILKTAAVACFAISAANADVFWDLNDHGGQVETGGYWYGYGDEKEDGTDGKGGCTATDFPPGSMDEDIVGPEWQSRGGAVTYTHTAGCTYKFPFAGFGANWFDPKATVKEVGTNPLNGIPAITVYYTLTGTGATCKIEIGADAATKYNNFTATLPTGDKSSGHTIALSSFKQDTGWGTTTTLDNAIQESDALKFKCQFSSVTDPASVVLTLKKIEFGGGTPILSGNLASPAKLSLANNLLSISGINSDVKVDIVNLQGALVNSGVIGTSKSISLSNLPSGVYMVRVSSLNLTQKIMVK